ncbi:MAG: glutamate racemase [bacterium]|nr:glutamate racemase [bacterium]
MKHWVKQSFSILNQNRSLNNKSPVAIFDSGIGGLTVARRLHSLLPGEQIIYFGDTARVPYGTKSHQIIRQYATQIASFLVKFNPKIIIIACHSVSSLGRSFLERRFSDFVFFDVIQPSVKEAIRVTKNRKIGIIGTPATIASNSYPANIKRFDEGIRVYQKACPLLVPLVEEGWFDTDVTCEIVRHYLIDLLDRDIDTLVLGCTHYPLLKKSIEKIVGSSVHLVDASDATGKAVKEFLTDTGLLNSKEPKPPVLYFSDFPEYRRKIMLNFWNNRQLIIKKVNIERRCDV